MVEIKKLEKSQVEITGEISAEEFASFWSKAVTSLGKDVKIDGFRPGHIPEDVLMKNVGEGVILDTAAEMALQSNYPKLILENKIDVIGRPEVTITKIAKGNPLGFKIVTAVIPEVTLPDYKKIAKEVADEAKGKEVVVTDKEVDDLVEDIRRRRAHIEKVAKDEAEGGKHVHSDEEHKIADADLPAFDDEFVKTLGSFENVADFRDKMQKNLKIEKESMAKEASRFKTIDMINDKSQMELPDILVENELKKGINQMKGEVEQNGLDFDEYLKNVKKTVEEIKAESRPKAEKSVRYNLILKSIARKEGVRVPDEEIAKEADKLVKMYAGADMDSAKVYVEDILINNMVFKFLENN
ncbi:MAG: trigger factor [bacterium]|nr:trigger factor [bacterium]